MTLISGKAPSPAPHSLPEESGTAGEPSRTLSPSSTGPHSRGSGKGQDDTDGRTQRSQGSFTSKSTVLDGEAFRMPRPVASTPKGVLSPLMRAIHRTPKLQALC